MPDDTTRTVTITGAAAMGGKARRSRKRARGQKGGSHQSDLIISKFPDAMTPSTVPCDQVKGYQTPTLVHGAPLGIAYQPVMPQVPQSAVAAPAAPLIPQIGGKVKVELRKTQETKKVQLVPKQASIPETPVKKRKKTRKVMLGLVSLKKRQTRARHITDRVHVVPLEQLKKQLVEKGLIKTTSKAPESVLRQIAADSQIVAGYGL